VLGESSPRGGFRLCSFRGLLMLTQRRHAVLWWDNSKGMSWPVVGMGCVTKHEAREAHKVKTNSHEVINTVEFDMRTTTQCSKYGTKQHETTPYSAPEQISKPSPFYSLPN
jgi:hypothetical protein